MGANVCDDYVDGATSADAVSELCVRDQPDFRDNELVFKCRPKNVRDQSSFSGQHQPACPNGYSTCAAQKTASTGGVAPSPAPSTTGCIDRKPAIKCGKKVAKGKCWRQGVLKRCAQSCNSAGVTSAPCAASG